MTRKSPLATSTEPKLPKPLAVDAPLGDWALWNADVGRITGAWKVFPLRPGEKPPLHKGWQGEADWDGEAVASMWQRDPQANIGLAIQPGFVAVDVDDWSAFESLEEKHGQFPETYKQRTARGGAHFVCRIDVDTGNATGNLPRGIDIRGSGGYIVGAGSLLAERGEEKGRWSAETLHAPVHLPDWFAGYLTKRKASKSNPRQNYGDPIGWDYEQADRLIAAVLHGKLIKNYPGPFREGERDNLTFRLFAEAKNHMIHPDVMLEAISNSAIDGGLDEDDGGGTVERKMRSAYYDGNAGGYGEKVNAYWLPNYVFKPFVNGKSVDREPVDPVKWKATNPHKLPQRIAGYPESEPAADPGSASTKPEGLYDGPEYADRPQPRWLIDGVLQEAGYAIASGRSQAGKSFCELAKALAVATGKPWLGLSVVTTGPVLYVAAEGQGRIWRDVCAWCAEFGVDLDSLGGRFFIYDRSARLNTQAGREALTEILAYIKRVTGRSPILAVFDTLRRNMRGGVSQEEPTSDVLHAVNELQAGCIAITLVAHHGRGHGETKGLTEWEDDADTVAIYTGTVRESTTTVTFKKIKAAEDGWSLAVEYKKRLLPDGETTLVAAAGTRAERNASGRTRDRYVSYDAIAAQILESMTEPYAKRATLATAVLGELASDLREQDTMAFNRELDAYKKHLTRLPHNHPLWSYVDEKNDRGQPLTFRNPARRGRRAPKPGRRGVGLTYPALSVEGEDA